MSDPLIKVSREGTQIGLYTQSEAIEALKTGELRPDDAYWQEGMTTWKQLSSLQPVTTKELIIGVVVGVSILFCIIWAIAEATGMSLREVSTYLQILRFLGRH